MIWKELALNKPASLTFPDGTVAVVSYYSQTEESGWRGHVRIAIPGKSKLNLLDAIDYGSARQITKLFGRDPSNRVRSTLDCSI